MRISFTVFVAAIISLSAPAQLLQPYILASLTNNPANPNAMLLEAPDGNFYGTSLAEGGTVFRITPQGLLTTLVTFTGTNGLNPEAAGLTLAQDGNLYSTTEYGGSGLGTLFRITTNGEFTQLVQFNGDNGFYPRAGGLSVGDDGDLYGITFSFNTQYYFGTAYKITTEGLLTTLARFTNTSPGAILQGHLTLGNDGSFYGASFGRVFKLTTNGIVTTVATGGPTIGGLTLGNDGALYGTTRDDGSGRRGTVFRVTTDGVWNTLVGFYGTNGADPFSRLTQASGGNFYGVTIHGGSGGEGTVYKMSPLGELKTLAEFSRTNREGWGPYGGVIVGSTGSLYGTTRFGGYGGGGAIFRLDLPPEIISQPVNRTNTIGTTAIFDVTVGGTKPFSYQWLKNGTNLLEGGNVSGTDTTTLMLANVQANDAGKFSVVVINGSGSVTSSVASLVIGLIDTDGDGVPDSQDECPGTASDAAVEEHGCSVEQLVPCAGPRFGGTWKNHPQYVAAVTATVAQFLLHDLISETEAENIIKAAFKSKCGKRGKAFP